MQLAGSHEHPNVKGKCLHLLRLEIEKKPDYSMNNTILSKLITLLDHNNALVKEEALLIIVIIGGRQKLNFLKPSWHSVSQAQKEKVSFD